MVGLNRSLAKVARIQGKEICKCIKDGSRGKLGAGTIEECTTADRKGRIARQCVARLARKVGRKCTGLDHASLFPGLCAGAETLADFTMCIERRVECRVCLALNEADAIDRNCDRFDDGDLNASCPRP